MKKLKDLTIKEFVEISRLDLNTMLGQAKFCEIISGKRVDELGVAEFFEIVTTASEYLKPEDTTFKNTIELNGKTYKAKNLKEFNVGEFIDLDTFMNNQDLMTILAIIYTDEVDGEDYVDGVNRRKVELEKLDAETGMNAVNFFVYALLDYVENIADCSTAELTEEQKKQLTMVKETKKVMGALFNDGVGN